MRKGQDLSVRVLSMHTLTPLDRDAIANAARETGAIVTVEEHMTHGGIGSAVADTLVDLGIACPSPRRDHAGDARPRRIAALHALPHERYSRGDQGRAREEACRTVTG